MSVKEKKPSYKETLNLPSTSFSLRAHAEEKEPALRTQWSESGALEQFFADKGNGHFVLHDGPPYANGNIHLGTTLNKVLKDIMVRIARLSGKRVSFRPGWDCHGMPIELKVIEKHGAELRANDPIAFKKACRAYAQGWKETQEKQFQSLGVWAQWDKPYLTMTPSYEAEILRCFARFVEKGFIERKGKTVPWCFSCETVLANIEIEYEDRKDPSCYILFEAHNAPEFSFVPKTLSLSYLIWTTTPWTIPLNRAVVLHPNAQYAIVQIDDNRAAIVGAELVEKLSHVLEKQLTVLGTVQSSELIGGKAQHPLVADLQVPIISDEGVSIADGTACLHSAPGCGPEDYLMGIKNNLEIYSPLASNGTYTEGIAPQELIGMPITDGQWWVLKQLKAAGALLHKASIKHSYPHCWRCRNGLMFRATDQWFCNLAKNNLIERARASLDKIEFIPSWGKTRLSSFLEHRTEWCISRQRSWGSPIPALFNTQTGETFISASFVDSIADRVAQEGVEFWEKVTVAQLRAEGLLPDSFAQLPDENIRKETDILDVWFDSGVSHQAAIASDGQALPVDMYLEGSDQHRGWFQSSLLTALALKDEPQTKAIVTHGFVVDEKGHKMSKSRGNVVDPQDVVKKFGADVLRLWCASVDYERDVSISPKMLEQVAQNYRKLRNTCRFLLSNLYDFNPEADAVAFSSLRAIDAYAVSQAHAINEQVQEQYNRSAFAQAVQMLTRYCTVDLSAQYLDISKDRLYVERANSHARRSAQTAQYHILQILNRLLAPLLVYTADDVYASAPFEQEDASVHLTRFIPHAKINAGSSQMWEQLHAMREAILRAIEAQREVGAIKHSLEAAVTCGVPSGSEWEVACNELRGMLGSQTLESFFTEWCIVSSFAITQDDQVTVVPSEGQKCPRCWHWCQTQHEDGLCHRCQEILQDRS